MMHDFLKGFSYAVPSAEELGIGVGVACTVVVLFCAIGGPLLGFCLLLFGMPT